MTLKPALAAEVDLAPVAHAMPAAEKVASIGRKLKMGSPVSTIWIASQRRDTGSGAISILN